MRLFKNNYWMVVSPGSGRVYTGITTFRERRSIFLKNLWLKFRQFILRWPCSCSRSKHEKYHKHYPDDEWNGWHIAPNCDSDKLIPPPCTFTGNECPAYL